MVKQRREAMAGKEIFMNYYVKVLTHKKIAGTNLDGSDAKYSKGQEKTVLVTLPNANIKDHVIFELAKRKCDTLVTRLISIKKLN